jgi:hypothetical protein
MPFIDQNVNDFAKKKDYKKLNLAQLRNYHWLG